MYSLKCNTWQINYLYYIFTYYACCSESSYDKLYILTGVELQRKINRLLKKQKASYKLKLSGVETLLFNECISMYIEVIKLDKKLVIENLYLNQVCNQTKQNLYESNQ